MQTRLADHFNAIQCAALVSGKQSPVTPAAERKTEDDLDQFWWQATDGTWSVSLT